jgi:hypothetical protein
VVVSHAGAGWFAETFDLSPRGCQLVTPRPLGVGGAARLVIQSPEVLRPLAVSGKVAWMKDQGRIRAGISFADRQSEGDPAAWFKKLVAKQPGIETTMRRVPERLPLDTKLFLRPPPQFIFDFGPEEVATLRALGDGITIAHLMRKVALSAAQVTRVVFALLEQRVITLSLGEAAPGWKWKAALADFEAGRGERPHAPPRAAPASRSVPANDPFAHLAGTWPMPDEADAPPFEAAPPIEPTSYAETVPPLETAPPEPGEPVPAPEPQSPVPVVRSPEAQECYDLAVSAVALGEISTAIGLLRRALRLAPRDAEISALLGQLAFRDRQVEPD